MRRRDASSSYSDLAASFPPTPRFSLHALCTDDRAAADHAATPRVAPILFGPFLLHAPTRSCPRRLLQPHAEPPPRPRHRLRHGLHARPLPRRALGRAGLPLRQRAAARPGLARRRARVRSGARLRRAGHRHGARQPRQGRPFRLRQAGDARHGAAVLRGTAHRLPPRADRPGKQPLALSEHAVFGERSPASTCSSSTCWTPSSSRRASATTRSTPPSAPRWTRPTSKACSKPKSSPIPSATSTSIPRCRLRCSTRSTRAKRSS